MSEEPDNEDGGIELQIADPVVISEDMVWVGDPDTLHPEAECEGVLALMLRGGCLFYFDGALRQWVNVEDKGPKKARLSTIQ
ncbi:hypothetical protein [Pseudoxanthomonas dokdonensis]|uniref:Uncharacterized protein n=1 Tax=Pseudoxanthomonas dokdonensis TaxID=344882 RepID=A0A0R0CGY1_9GAMM|nr:hypothetical protein [Pseudoxanthomonas dokdonensis]KRG69132.1 hypothetical protein ABB29_12040 [Pseudoxanthomonas dokdonensis]